VSRYFFSKLVALLTGIILLVVAYIHNTNSLYYLSGDAYGTSWSISSSEYIADNHKDEIRNIISDIDFIASNYKSESEISQININFSESQFISKDLFNILKIAKDVETVSEGFYNIMLGKVSSNLGFAPDFGQKVVQKKTSSYELDEKNNSLIRYSNNWFDLSSIAKGYAVQKIHDYLTSNNLNNHLIDIGGELVISGTKKGEPWNIGIQNPLATIESSTITISNKNHDFLSIATSGEYRNYKFDDKGNKVTHTINPKTLSSISNNILSVTIVNETSATYADAYATAFNAMGVKKAIDVANSNNIASMIIFKNEDNVDIIYSDKWYDLFL